MASLKVLLQNDSRVTKLSARFLNADENTEQWNKEISALHASRGIRSLNTTALLQSSQHVSIETGLENQSIRSRCVEIKLRALKKTVALSDALDAIKKYILVKYASSLAEYRTQSDKKAAIENALSSMIDMKKRLDLTLQLADLVIEDCDAAGHALYRITLALEQRSREK